MDTDGGNQSQSSLLPAEGASAADIVVMTSGAFTPAYLSLAHSFADSSGDRFITAATKMGAGASSIPSRLAAGELVDIVIVASGALEKLTADGRIVNGSRVDLARSSIAMAVRQGATRPDIGSVEGLKRTLLSTSSVALSRSVSGDYFVKELFPRLGIAGEMRSKTKIVEPGDSVGAVVARGEAEIGFQQVSELRLVRGIEIVGPLPGDTQRVTVFSAGIAATSKRSAAARAFLAFLASPAAQKVIEDTGLEPVHPG
jgi:molybdate transport system substrate-binding protein